MSPALAEENAKMTGKPRESHRALSSSWSMFSSVDVRLFFPAMNEKVRVTGPGEARLDAGAPSTTSAPTDKTSATEPRVPMIRFISDSLLVAPLLLFETRAPIAPCAPTSLDTNRTGTHRVGSCL